MPSASSAKLEKQASSNQAETSDNNSVVTPIRQALVIIDHKIRNLEKRKTKLETYREVQSSGKELTQDQKAAVAKYEEVAHSLEFARELSKQMLHIATAAEKEQKKQARKEIILKAQAETAKIREVLTIQDILFRFTNAEVREDFLNGCNGAAKLEENDLTVLEKFYNDIQAKRQSQPEDIPFIVAAQKAAEYLSMTIDGRPKQYGETTFENVRRILQSIQDCGYFDKSGKVEIIEEEIKCDEEASQMAEPDVILDETVAVVGLEIRDSASDDEVKPTNPQIVAQPQPKLPIVEVPKFQSEAPAAAAVPAPTFPQNAPQPTIAAPQLVSQPQLQRPLVPPQVAAVSQAPIPPVAAVPTVPAPATPIHAGHFPPTTVRAVEQTYYKQQYIQQMRPLAEVIGSANFFFLQESELDSPDLVPSGYAPSEPQPQGQVPNMPPVAGTLAPQSPTGANNLAAQPVLPQQIAMVQPGMQGKTQPQAPTNAPIPSQTFTNQSFPTIVPPPAMFPQGMQNPEIPSSQPQMQVFTGAPMPIPQLVAQPVAVSQSQPASLPSAENLPPTIGHVDQAANPANLITGPSGANVPLPCFSNVAMAAPPMGHPQATNQLKTPVDTFEAVQTSKQVAETKLHKVDESKEGLPDNSNDWDANENNQKPVSTLPEEESNQWSNEVNNTNKNSNEWTVFDNNQNESNTWNAGQNEAYNNRNNGARSGGGFSGNANRTGGGNRGTRNGPAPNNYRGRSNNSFPQQNGRNAGMYFRNNTDNNYYQNQNGAYTAGKDTSGNFGGNGNNTFRLRGGPVSASNRQPSGGRISGQTNNGTTAAPRSNSNPNRNSIGISNSNSRAGRTNGGNNANYGSSRPPNNVRQPQQDVNA